jgi:nucleobase transporter 1/2
MKVLNSGCRISVPYPFQWGGPTFDAGEAFAMMMTSFIAIVEVCLQYLPENRKKIHAFSHN